MFSLQCYEISIRDLDLARCVYAQSVDSICGFSLIFFISCEKITQSLALLILAQVRSMFLKKDPNEIESKGSMDRAYLFSSPSLRFPQHSTKPFLLLGLLGGDIKRFFKCCHLTGRSFIYCHLFIKFSYVCNGWNGQLPQARLILLSPFEIG